MIGDWAETAYTILFVFAAFIAAAATAYFSVVPVPRIQAATIISKMTNEKSHPVYECVVSMTTFALVIMTFSPETALLLAFCWKLTQICITVTNKACINALVPKSPNPAK